MCWGWLRRSAAESLPRLGQGLVGAVGEVEVFAAQLFVGVELVVAAHTGVRAAGVALAVEGIERMPMAEGEALNVFGAVDTCQRCLPSIF